MSEEKSMRLSQAARILNLNHTKVASVLASKGHKVDNNPNTKLNYEQLEFLAKEFKSDVLLSGGAPKKEEPVQAAPTDDSPVLYFRSTSQTPAPKPATEEAPKPAPQPEPPRAETSSLGLKVVGKIDLDAPKTPPPAPVPAPKPEEKPVEAAQPTPPTPVVVAPVKEETKPAPVEIKPVPVPEPAVIAPPAPVAEVTKPVEVEKPVAVEKPKVETPAPVAVESTPKVEPPAAAIPEPAKPADKPVQPAKPAQHEQRPDNRQKGQQDNRQRGQQDDRQKGQQNQQKPQNPAAKPKPAPEPVVEPELIEAKAESLKGLTILGKIELPVERRPGEGGGNRDRDKKRKRKRLRKGEKVTGDANQQNKPKTGDKPADANKNKPATTTTPAANSNNAKKGTSTNAKKGGNRREKREEISAKEVTDSIKATNARLSGVTRGKNFGADKRRERRKQRAEAAEERMMQEQEDLGVLKVTEYISANDLASLMDVSVQEVISVCMSMGMFVSINQRLDAESITLIADEFEYEVEFISAEEEIQADVQEIVDAEEDLIERAPIVTIMGHVDHGKTSLLDYIRRTRVAAGEAGGITQHIGAYSVKTDGGRRITFLDTPGHEAFTAMRARGAKVTDVVIIVIAADDSVMPQTREAINHALNAGVPIVFAFSKIDKPGANTEKIREALAGMNMLVEEWGGKYQTQEISSKSGQGISDLLEKVLLEADLLELKANPDRRASGTVIEATLDKGRGYVNTILVETGTLRVGDVILAGAHFGKVRAMFDATGSRLKEAGPSTPVQLLGLNGAPQAGDKINAMETEREAREIANKREQIMREQSIRTRKHITLEEIGRRKAIGTFKELNIIVKGDVDGSVEALSDSLLKLSTEEVQVNIINKAVGQIAESDINLAIAADAIIVGFQVRPSASAKKLAEQEQIEIRLYSVIYDAINEIKDAMAGMLEPTMEEVIIGNAEIREVFKISKVGTVAGCMVTDGLIKRNNKVRIVRDFIVIYEGEISQLKRFKDDVNEVRSGFDCGLSIKGFNDIQIGDVIESYEMKEVKRTL
ncbi:MAG: translation initiation factor IF-2 [Spirosomaceae bacterium]|nr:translation initiation factor IF-2 [Spirosomataceae bacterium]